MSNRNLIILLVVLLGIFLITKMSDRRGERNFKDILIELDSTIIDRVILHNVQDDQSIVELKKTNGQWTAKNDQLEVIAQRSTVSSLLNTLQLVKSKRLISKSEDKWADYEVDDAKGTRVEVFSGSKKIDDFMVGRFNFNQQARTATSYIRKTDESDTYSVDGFLSMSFNQSFNSFRDKNLVKVNSSDINQIRMSSQEQNLLFNKQENNWISSTGEMLDSTKIAQYINVLSNTVGSEFDDNFVSSNTKKPKKTLEIFGDNMAHAIQITCYGTEDSIKPFILHSSLNEEAYFKSDSTGIYKKLFGDLEGIQ